MQQHGRFLMRDTLPAAAVLLSLLPFTATPAADGALTQRLESIRTAPHRSEANRRRDNARHPVETLQFFGLRPDMKVLEITPGRGWYTEWLAPLLAEKGTLVTASFGANHPNDYLAGLHQEFMGKLKQEPDVYRQVRVITFQGPDFLRELQDGSMDLVLTFRNTHNWIRSGIAKAIYHEFARVLRPGGTLGVVQHRIRNDLDAVSNATQGYVRTEHIIALAKDAGLRLEQRSEINANPRDTHDYSKGVWTLPPTYRLKDQDRARYERIGESDRITLRFIRPGT